MLMAVAVSSRSSDRTRRTMFSSAWSNGRPRLTSRMTRPNSVETGGRDSRTTRSIGWRNEGAGRRGVGVGGGGRGAGRGAGRRAAKRDGGGERGAVTGGVGDEGDGVRQLLVERAEPAALAAS